MKTIEQRITEKAKRISKRYSDHIMGITVCVDDERERETFGSMFVNFEVYSSFYKDRNGNLMSHDHTIALSELEKWLIDSFGLYLVFEGDGSGDGVVVYTYRVLFCKG